MAALAACDAAPTESAGRNEASTPPPAIRSAAMCDAFALVEQRIVPALSDAEGADAIGVSFAALEVVTVGADIVEMARAQDGVVAADLVALGEAWQHQGQVMSAVAANPQLPAEDADSGSDAYAELLARYEC